jgi:ABC-2 type transport system permease protein
MIGYAFIFDLIWPKGFTNILAVGLSIFLSWLISFSWRFLINLTSFWTPNARGILRFFFVLSWFFSGFLMPLRFFPEWVIRISYLMPFPHMINTVVEIYLGVLDQSEILLALGYQVIWVLILIAAGQIVLRRGVHRLVILGG